MTNILLVELLSVIVSIFVKRLILRGTTIYDKNTFYLMKPVAAASLPVKTNIYYNEKRISD